MVAEVENIVRSIEDEKIQKEERDKTRDVFARIEGLDRVRQLALPKPSRVLLEERPCNPGASPLNGSKVSSSPPPAINSKGVRGKSSFKRLSDVLGSGGVGGKKDLWYVVFNDVVLQCQRTGTTSVPITHTTTNRVNSLPDMGGKSKYATTGRRNSYTKPRNLYKFLKVCPFQLTITRTPRAHSVCRSRRGPLVMSYNPEKALSQWKSELSSYALETDTNLFPKCCAIPSSIRDTTSYRPSPRRR